MFMIFSLANNFHTSRYAWTMFILTADELMFYVTELYYYNYLNVFLWYYFNVNCAESKVFLSLIWFYLAWICTRSITGLVTFDTETQLKNKCTSIMYLKCIIKNVFVLIFFI